MNEIFKQRLKERQLTAYELARKAGTPYTTISRIINDKMDINNVAVGTLYRFSVVLDTTVEDLLNPIAFMDGAGGHCGKISYKWKCVNENETWLLYRVAEEDKTEVFPYAMNIKRYRKYYDLLAEMRIEQQLETLKFEQRVQKYLEGTVDG